MIINLKGFYNYIIKLNNNSKYFEKNFKFLFFEILT